jgi:hypothetical protein
MLISSIFSLFLVGVSAQPGMDAALRRAAAAADYIQVQAAPSPTSHFGASQCRSIADLSASNKPVFITTENGEWECTYQLEYSETGHTPSLFIQIRGIEPGVWSSFRIKLNFGSLLSRQVLGARAANLVNLLVGTNNPLGNLEGVLATGRELEITFDDVTLKYQQERLDPNRFNLFGSKKLSTKNPMNRSGTD